ncbi:MAG: aldose 1-epimerase [Flavobacteriaceae bacterium]
MNSKIVLQKDSITATILNGELISLKCNNEEFIHQKGNKGWSKSDDEMFPIIGNIKKNDFKVITKKGVAIQDQHGLLREMNYNLLNSNLETAKYIKTYTKNTLIKNSKYPKKSTKEHVFWPYDFIFKKEFSILNNGLKIDFIFNSEKNMPFMLGYHPAFLLSNTGNEKIECESNIITIKDVLNAGANAFPFLNSNTILLHNIQKKNIEITTTGFKDFMLWTEVNNMLCIEPITTYVPDIKEVYSEKNMLLSKEENRFSILIKII